MTIELVAQQTTFQPPQDFWGFLYFLLAALLTISIETLRRYIKHRMDIWEANNPVRESGNDSDRRTTGEY